MDYLITFADRWLDDPALLQWVAVLSAGLLFFVISLGILFLGSSFADPVRRRARSWISSSDRQQTSAWRRSVQRVAPYITPSDESEQSRVRRRLMIAGYRSPNAVSNFYAAKVVLALGLPLVVTIAAMWIPRLATFHVILGVLTASGLGVFIPNYALFKAGERRKRRLTKSLPDALDLLVVCTEAGYGLKAAIQRVADELNLVHPELAAEFAQTDAEMRAGVERKEALHNLVTRNELEEIRGLVTLLVQSMQFGTSVADSLRIYAEEFRDKRMQQAEEKAATIQTKMIFPLVVCIFPAFFVVTVGPPLLGVIELFARM